MVDVVVKRTKTDVDQTIVNKETGELFANIKDRLESSSQKELIAMNNQLVHAEVERKKAWSKLMITKSELEIQPTRGRGS